MRGTFVAVTFKRGKLSTKAPFKHGILHTGKAYYVRNLLSYTNQHDKFCSISQEMNHAMQAR